MQPLQSRPMCFFFAGNSVRQNLRRAGFAFFGIFNGTEFNPDFYKDIEAAVDKQKGAVLVCGVGGILEPLGRGGRQSRLASSSLHFSLLLSSRHHVNITKPVKLPVYFKVRTAAGCQALKCRELYRLLQLGWVFFGIYLMHVMTMPCCCAEAVTFILQQDFVQQHFYGLCLLYGTAV